MERMQEALPRILGLKAHMGLQKKKLEQLVPSQESLSIELQKPDYLKVQKAISENGITLVKYKDKDVLPITPKRYKRIMLVHVKGAETGF